MKSPSRSSTNKAKPKKVLVLFEVLAHQMDVNANKRLPKDSSWDDERNVVKACLNLGYDVDIFGIHDNIQELLTKLDEYQPDVVFNLAEAFNNDRDKEADIASMIQLLDIKYTGACPKGLNLCKNKAISKKILLHEGIAVPNFWVVDQKGPIPKMDFNTRYIVKPIDFEGSEGIHFKSVVANQKNLKQQVRQIHQDYSTSCIIEEFIEGREIYIGVIGNKKLEVFPPIEFYLDGLPSRLPSIASYKAKWDESFRKKYKLRSGPARSLAPEVLEQLNRSSQIIYKVFTLQGYARLDFRITKNGKIYFLEANPNPSIAKDDEFAKAAKKAGYKYPELIEKIVCLAAVA